MTKTITITEVEQDGVDGVTVTFSDETTAGYVVEELLELRPNREHALKTLEQHPDVACGA
jgi:hypothetical protein